MTGPHDPLIDAVRANCAISYARHAHEMTMCVYLLAMRELYRWEQGLALMTPLPRARVGAWLAEREAQWSALEDASYRPLPLGGAEVDPYDVARVNEVLVPDGLVYGAGVGRRGKPQFFVAALERDERRNGTRVLVAGREHARDLDAAPAALRGDTMYIRQETLARVLSEKAEAWSAKRGDGALKAALDAHGVRTGSADALAAMVAAETETLILHELGEREAGGILGPGWEEALSACDRREAGAFLRAVRDHLADCLVTLPALVGRGADASLHLWFADLDGVRRDLFPRAIDAYREWCGGDEGRALDAAIAEGASHWRSVGLQALALAGRPDAAVALEDYARSPEPRL